MITEPVTIEVGPFVRRVKRRWPILLSCALLGGALGYAYVKFSPPIYRAQAVILLPLTPPPGSQTGSIASSGGLLSKGPTPIDVISGVLLSRRVTAPLAEESQLKIKDVESEYKIDPQTGSNQIQIRVEDRNPDRALKMVQQSLTVLQETNRDLSLSMADRQANALRDAVQRQEREMHRLDAKVVSYEKKLQTAPDASHPYTVISATNRVIDLSLKYGELSAEIEAAKKLTRNGSPGSTTIPGSTQGTERWRATLEESELEWRLAEQELAPTNPKVIRLRDKYQATLAQFRKAVAASSSDFQSGQEPKIADLTAQQMATKWSLDKAKALATRAPVESVGLQRLLNQLDVASKVYIELRQRYEEARIGSEVDEAKWSLLVPPYIADEPINKSAGTLSILGALLGGLVGLFVINRRSGVV